MVQSPVPPDQEYAPASGPTTMVLAGTARQSDIKFTAMK